MPEDLDIFLSEDGLPCVFGAQSFLGILDQPAQVLDFEPARVQTIEYELRFISTQASLSRGESGTVGGIAYTVRSAPRQVGDGAFSLVTLTKV
jgi:hypothetical protein